MINKLIDKNIKILKVTDNLIKLKSITGMNKYIIKKLITNIFSIKVLNIKTTILKREKRIEISYEKI